MAKVKQYGELIAELKNSNIQSNSSKSVGLYQIQEQLNTFENIIEELNNNDSIEVQIKKVMNRLKSTLDLVGFITYIFIIILKQFNKIITNK